MRIILCLLLLLIINTSCLSQECFEPLFKCSKKLDNPYGICTHINRKGPRYEYDIREKDMSMTDSIGTTWIRTDWDWGPLKTKQGGLNFANYDSMMVTVRKHHKQVLGILDIDKRTKVSEDWIRYVEQSVLRYKDVRFWEMLIEVDLRHEFVPGFYSNHYVPFLKQGYLMVKRTNRNAKVLFSGMAYIDRGEIDSILSQGVASYFDIMNVHNYSRKDYEPEKFIDFYRKLRGIMSRYGVDDKHLWVTETGGTTMPGRMDEETQARNAPRIMLISLACGVDRIFWYKTRAREMDPQASVDYYGLLHKDYTPKPAFYTYRTIIRMCPDKSTRPKLMRQGNVYVASWKRPDGKRAWALWTSKTDEVIGLDIKGGYKMYNDRGEEVSDGDISEMRITPSVIYIIGAKEVSLR